VTPASVTITGTGNTQFALVLQTFCRAAGIGPNPQVPGGGLKLLLLAMALAAMPGSTGGGRAGRCRLPC